MRVGFYFVVAGLIVAGIFAMPLLCADVAALDAENQAALHIEALDQDCVDLINSGVGEYQTGSMTLSDSAEVISDHQTDIFMAQLNLLQAELVPSLDIMIRD